ncbi:MAG TPA: DNA recombination protein RmuC, partial [Erysipelotrichaceae bacterium]|nr:DNA recombination protein RmuC [Erysipelotrichaceae bacterium]
MEAYLLFIVGFIILGLLVIVFIWRSNLKQQVFLREMILKSSESSNKDLLALKNEINRDLLVFQNQISQAFKDDLNMLNKNTSQTLSTVQNTMHEGLSTGFEKTNFAFLEMSKQLVSIDKTQKNLATLSKDIVALQNVLTDKKTRGIYGEVELYSILKSAYGLNDHAYQKQYRLSNGSIADAVLFAPDPLKKIVIDSKFPLENYLKMYDVDESRVDQQKARQQFRRDVLKHIDDISTKYIIKNETAEMAYMFIPAEAIFSEIYGRFEDIINISYEKNVYLVSPTTLMAYITAIKAIYLGQKQNEKVDQIQEEYGRLAIEFERFEKRFSTVVNDFEKTFRDINDVNITAIKIINRFKDIEAVDLEKLGESK